MESKRTEQLAKEGWARRFTGIGPRLDEMVQLYESLGFEVRLEAPDLDELPGQVCHSCFLVESGHFYTLFTRSKQKGRF